MPVEADRFNPHMARRGDTQHQESLGWIIFDFVDKFVGGIKGHWENAKRKAALARNLRTGIASHPRKLSKTCDENFHRRSGAIRPSRHASQQELMRPQFGLALRLLSIRERPVHRSTPHTVLGLAGSVL